MMEPRSTLTLLVFGFTFVASVYGQCTDSNGGCSHFCLDRGDGNTECACPCLMQLAANSLDCVAINPCDVDLTVIMDVSYYTDLYSCLTGGLLGSAGYPVWGFFQNWRDKCTEIIAYFLDDNSGPQWNVGLQLFDTKDIYENLHTYMDTSLQPAIDNLLSRNQPVCSGEVAYIDYLGYDIENHPTFTNHQYRGPGTRRDAVNTTRIALVLVAQAALRDLATLQLGVADAMTGFDDILVVSQNTRTLPNSASETQQNDETNKQVACGDSNAMPCPDYFFIDAQNDLGQNPTEANLKAQMSLDSCLARRLANNPIVAQPVCGTTMSVNIPLCLLDGLTLDDLTLNDPSCLATGSTSATHVTVNIPFIQCGIVTTLDNVTGNTNLIQVIKTRIHSASQVLPNISISVECAYPTTQPEVIVPYAGIMQEAPLQDMGASFYDLAFTLSTSSDFSTSLSAMSSVVVTCPVYGQAIASGLSSSYSLRMVSCFATSTSSPSDPLKYYLASGACVLDSTFQFLPETDNTLVDFSFNFFEYASTYKKSNAEKLPVYIHCSFTACVDGDTSGSCDPTCSIGRRKRFIDDPENLVVKSLGPFMVEDEPQSPDVKVMIASGQGSTALAIFDDFVIAFAVGLIIMMVVVVFVMQKRQTVQLQKGDNAENGYPPNYFTAVLGQKPEDCEKL